MGVAAESEVRLIKLAARGNAEAFATLFDTYQQAVYNFALWLSNDADLSEDLTQDTFVRAHGSLNQLGPPWKLRSWLFRMARNLYFNHRRDHPSTSPLDSDTNLPSVDLDPEKQMLYAELSGPVRGALTRLSPQNREALVLREIEGFHYDEIAEIMGVSLENVKVVLHRARASFKDNYGVRLLMEEPQPDCDALRELLDAYHDGELADQSSVVAHIKDCPTCQQRKRQMAAILILLKAQPTFKAPADLERRTLANTRPASRGRRPLNLIIGGGAITIAIVIWWFFFGPASGDDTSFGGGGGGDDAASTPTEPTIFGDAAQEITPSADICQAGWLPSAGCSCCGTTLLCADGTVAEFNPACDGSGSVGQCSCVCIETDPQTKKCIKGYDSCNPQNTCLP